MKKIVFLLLISTFLLACNSTPKEKVLTATEKNVQEQKAMDAHKSVVPTMVMDATITGMTCTMGCGSTIRKGLYLTGGVAKVEYDFEDEREENEIKIYFDDKKVSQEDIIAAVGELNDGQYQISNPSTSKIDL